MATLMATEPKYGPTRIADILGVTPATVHRWIRDWVLRAVNVQMPRGRRPTYRVLHTSLVVFMRERGFTEEEMRRLLLP